MKYWIIAIVISLILITGIIVIVVSSRNRGEVAVDNIPLLVEIPTVTDTGAVPNTTTEPPSRTEEPPASTSGSPTSTPTTSGEISVDMRAFSPSKLGAGAKIAAATRTTSPPPESVVEATTVSTPSGYTARPGCNISGFDIGKYTFANIDEAAGICNSKPECRAFTSTGWLKRTVTTPTCNQRLKNNGVVLYIKN